MKKQFYLFSLFFVSVLITSTIFIHECKTSESYYNWIQNPSFVTYSNYIEDGSFESGEYNSGLTYGNFSGGDVTMDFSLELYHSGVYGLKDNGVGDDTVLLMYNLSSSYYFQGADLVSIQFYAGLWFTGESSADIKIRWYYSDFTSNDATAETITYAGGWKLCDDFEDDINSIKTVVAFSIVIDGGGGSYPMLDDIVMLVNDGDGQDEIVFGGNNYWQLGQTSSSYAPYFGNINSVFGRLDNTSCQLDSPYETYKIIQYIDFLYSDSIQYINLHIYGADVADSEGIKIKLLYSDGSTDEKTVLATGDGSSWEELIFGKSWIDSGKYITLIYIYPVFDGEGGSFNIDDVGLWSSLPYGYNKFVFSISPYPIEKGSYDFDAYSETTYTFTGYFYNITDLTLSINGTYQLSDSFGLHTGNMTNGLFSLQLDKRTYSISPYTIETLSVTIITDEEIFNVDITAYWHPVSGGVTDTTGDVDSDFLTDWTLIGILLLVPSLTFTGIGASINPTMGLLSFLGGLTIMGGICLTLNIINIGFMFAIIIVDVLIILGLLRFGVN